MKILLLEDDVSLGEILGEFLREEGYELSLATDAEQAMNLAYEKNFDLWILDVKVPLGDGFSLLRELRELGKGTPAIFMTSLNSTEDLREGFNAGCDDYIKKPFELAELGVRIRALLKRSFAHKNEDFEELGDGFRFALFSQILYKNDEALNLPGKEIKLLKILLKHKNIFLSSEKILEELWDYDENPSELSLRAYVKNIRKIIGRDKIINQRGRGYKICLK